MTIYAYMFALATFLLGIVLGLGWQLWKHGFAAGYGDGHRAGYGQACDEYEAGDEGGGEDNSGLAYVPASRPVMNSDGASITYNP